MTHRLVKNFLKGEMDAGGTIAALEQELECMAELMSAGRAMIVGKGWHEIDGECSICQRFTAAVEAAERAVAEDSH